VRVVRSGQDRFSDERGGDPEVRPVKNRINYRGVNYGVMVAGLSGGDAPLRLPNHI